jgi:hypothetical protein
LALFTLLGFANAFLWGYPALVKPALFRTPPPRPARLSTFAIMLGLPLLTPMFGLIALGYAPTWLVIPALALAVAVRVLRARAQRESVGGAST